MRDWRRINSVKYVWTNPQTSSSYHVVTWSAVPSVHLLWGNVQFAEKSLTDKLKHILPQWLNEHSSRSASGGTQASTQHTVLVKTYINKTRDMKEPVKTESSGVILSVITKLHIIVTMCQDYMFIINV